MTHCRAIKEETMATNRDWWLMIVVWLFLSVPRICLQFVIVVFPDHTIFYNQARRLSHSIHAISHSLITLDDLFEIRKEGFPTILLNL